MITKPYVVFVSEVHWEAVEIVGLPNRPDGARYGSFRRTPSGCWQYQLGREWFDAPAGDLGLLERLYHDYQERHGAYD